MFDLSQYREGQKLAHDCVMDRLRGGKNYTAIVLPTRYGKSDAMRMCAIDAWYSKLASVSLILSPNKVLRDQICDEEKWREMFSRYKCTVSATSTILHDRIENQDELYRFPPNNEIVVSATMQLAARKENRAIFAQWVAYQWNRYDRPPLIQIDECHTGSEENIWGSFAKDMAKAGARIVLWTATPLRADGVRIPGFKFAVEKTEEGLERHITKPGSSPELIKVFKQQGYREIVRLLPHHETTFQDAYNESPLPLCEITRLPFEVRIEEHECNLDELSPSIQREFLGRVVRQKKTIDAGTKIAVEVLETYRRAIPEAAMIVFCGVDNERDRSANHHAREIRKAIRAIDPLLRVEIATTSDGSKGRDRIKSFSKGVGDVLIVKQMASLGLDIKRLKVALDLSPVRTPAAFVQRLMRVATPHDDFVTCTYVSPKDHDSSTLFEEFIAKNGGECRHSVFETVRWWETERKEKERKECTVEDTALDDYPDTRQRVGKADLFADVQALFDSHPALIGVMSHSEASCMLERIRSGSMAKPEQPEEHSNDRKRERLLAEINGECKDVVPQHIGRLEGVDYEAAGDDRYGVTVKELWRRVYVACGVAVGTKLRDIYDLSMLAKVRDEWRKLNETL